MTEFLNFALTGTFGILTAAPVYLFFILLPAVFAINLLQGILVGTGLFDRLSLCAGSRLSAAGLSPASLLSVLMGFGCVTAALSSLSETNKRERLIASAILCIAVPCSAQVAIIATMSFLLNLPYILFFFSFIILFISLLIFALGRLIPGNAPAVEPRDRNVSFRRIGFRAVAGSALRAAIAFVLETAPVFCLGCLTVSLLMFTGIFSRLVEAAVPYTCWFLRLPPEASSMFILSLIKRDLGAASMLTIVRTGAFSQAEIVVCLIMLTFFVPCFASLTVLVNREGFLRSLAIWSGSLALATCAGKIASLILISRPF